MKPLDRRLLRYANAVRGVLAIGGLLGLLRTAAVLCWCWCVAHALTVLVLPVLGGLGGASGRVGEAAYPESALPWLLAGAAVAVVVRSVATWGIDSVAARGAVRVKTQLRSTALDAIDRRSPEWARGRADVGPATALGRGLDALDGYFSGYLPQLILTICATPFLVLAVLLADPLSGVTVLIVFPVIPLFMVLIGLATRAVQEEQWAQLERLSHSFLDVVEGLTTLKIYRREHRQVQRISRETNDYRVRTMKVLRVTFLSGFVLDLAGTFSIALVAVTVGTRLVAGEFPLALGLFVLLLLPEVFIPIRQVGAAFHASTEGLAASEQVFAIIEGEGEVEGLGVGASDEAVGAAGSGPDIAPAAAPQFETSDGIAFDAVEMRRGEHTVVGPVSFDVAPGEFVALAGPSGAGKTTLLSALLGFSAPASGEVSRPRTLSWAGQRPGLLQGSIAENVALGEARADLALVRRALDAVGLSEFAPEHGLGAQGAGLSGGQAQRVAIARCLYRAWSADAGAIVLDEPTSALDGESEARIRAALRAEAAGGRAVLVVSHRSGLLDAADRIVSIGAVA